MICTVHSLLKGDNYGIIKFRHSIDGYIVEDAIMDSADIIQFETLLSVHIREKFKNEIDQIYFFYPSPEDVLNKTVDVQEVQH